MTRVMYDFLKLCYSKLHHMFNFYIDKLNMENNVSRRIIVYHRSYVSEDKICAPCSSEN